MAGFLATAYGPPWNAMNGSGVTSTGVPLSGQVPVIAVDPNVIPYGSIVRASNSPLGQNKLFVAGDTGGAIKGNHIDFYVASGRPAQMGWGAQQIQLQVVKPGSGPGSVRSALQQVGSMGGGAAPRTAPQASSTSSPLSLGAPQTVTQQSFDQAGYNQALGKFIAGEAVKQSGGSSNPFNVTRGTSKGFSSTLASGVGPNPLFSKGLLTTTAPNAQDFVSTKTIQVAQNALQGLAGNTPLNVHPAARAGTVAGGFLPANAKYIKGRQDQGRDGQTNPGGPIVANGDGVVVNVLSNPGGFGPSYPVVKFTSGRYAGRTLYFGHTLAQVHPGQQVKAGQVISRTGTSPVGNASVPGWFEIGFADSGSPGPMGQPAPF